MSTNQLSRTADASTQLRNRILLRSSIICSIVVFACMFSSTTKATTPTITVTTSSGPVSASTIAAAFADCTSGNCEIDIPPGTWTMSSTVALTSSQNNITVNCMGDGWRNPSSTRGPTTIEWTGGSTSMFTSSSAYGITIRGCNIDNDGSATEFFDITNGFYIEFDHVTVYEPQHAFTTDAISCQPGTAANAYISVKDSILVDAAPIEINCDRVNTFHGERTEVRAINVGSTSATAAVQIGATTQSYDFDWINSSCDENAPGLSGEPSGGATETCINLIRLEGASITGNYFEVSEYGTGADQLAIRLAGGNVSGVQIAGNRFSGDSEADYAIETDGAPAVTIESNTFSGFASGGVHFISSANPTSVSVKANNVEDGTPTTNGSVTFTGTVTFPTAAIPVGSCGATQSYQMAGAVPGMPISSGFTTAPGTSDSLLTLSQWIASGSPNTVNFRQCNPTSGSLTPGGLTLGFQVN